MTALMTGKAVILYATPDNLSSNSTDVYSTNNASLNETEQIYTPVEVATAVTFLVGVIQVLYKCKKKIIIIITVII